jgi:hypothetical protein
MQTFIESEKIQINGLDEEKEQIYHDNVCCEAIFGAQLIANCFCVQNVCAYIPLLHALALSQILLPHNT